MATYAYDAVGLGRRTKKVVGSDTTRYINAGVQQVEELDGSNALLRLFVFGDRIDQVVMMEAPDQADVDGDSNASELVRLYFHGQLIGSVTHVTAAAETVVESYRYDPYGALTIKDAGGSTASASGVGNDYTYTGRQWDGESGLFCYRARQYSPALRRWAQRDPAEYLDCANAFTYCHGRPVPSRDPFGLAGEHDVPNAPTVGGGVQGQIGSAIGGFAGEIGPRVSFDPWTGRLCVWMELSVSMQLGPSAGGQVGLQVGAGNTSPTSPTGNTSGSVTVGASGSFKGGAQVNASYTPTTGGWFVEGGPSIGANVSVTVGLQVTKSFWVKCWSLYGDPPIPGGTPPGGPGTGSGGGAGAGGPSAGGGGGGGPTTGSCQRGGDCKACLPRGWKNSCKSKIMQTFDDGTTQKYSNGLVCKDGKVLNAPLAEK